LEFEEKNNLFDLEEDGLYIWDVLRYWVYLDYIWDNFQDQRQKLDKPELALRQLRRLGYMIRFLFSPSRPNFFFINSRDPLPDGRFYDRNAHDFLQRLAPESHILENFEDRHCAYLYPVSLFNFANLFKRFHSLFRKQRDYSDLIKKIKDQLGVNWDNRRVNQLVGHFEGERCFFKWLFRAKGTKRIFVTFAVTKALYCAARDTGVESIELQHGLIDKGHITYNYPAGVRDTNKVYCPDVLLTFSDFWCRDTHYPVKKIVAVGNTTLSDMTMAKKPFDPKDRAIGFISSDVFGHHMAELAIAYTQLHPEDRVFFKLHPNQTSRSKEYYKLFETYPAINVVTNEQPTERVVASCDAIVLIQSTIAYEALQAGIPVFIYKRMTYYRHDHIFNSPNVRLVDHAGEIVLTGQSKSPGSRDIFFDAFDERVYQQLSEGMSPTRTLR
jgi:hypothetical protein